MAKNTENNNDSNLGESIWKPISDYDSSLSPLSSSSADENINTRKTENSSSTVKKREEDDDDSNEDDSISRRKLFIIGGIAAISAIPLGLGSGYLYKKKNTNKEAHSELSNLRQSYGIISPVNTKIQTFEGQKLENVNIEQKSLIGGNNNNAEQAAVFIFSNAKNAPKRIVDVYIDFDSQMSRDFILINQSSLKNMVENGLIELRIHPVSSGSALSIYAPEALAEAFVTSPSLSWEFMLSLLKLSAEIQSNGDIEILPAIENKVAENGITDVSAESIQNGTFSSWIIAVGNDERLKTGYYPPIIYVNDTIVDPDIVDFNNTDSIRRHILNFDVKE